MLSISDLSGLALHRSDVVVCLDAQGEGEGDAARVALVEFLESAQDTVAAAVVIDETGELEAVAAAVAPADLVLLGAGSRLPPGWLQALSAAAGSDAVIATASALAAEHVNPDREPGLIAAGTGGGTPEPGSLARIDAPDGPCVYVRRSAIELVGLAPLPGFSERCRERGLGHVLAATVIADGMPVRDLGAGVSGLSDGALQGARLRARVARAELTVVIDARELNGPLNGTRVHLCELIRAVANTAAVDLTALLPAQLAPDTRRLLGQINGLHEVCVDGAGRPPENLRADVVHRPHQVHSYADLTVVAGLAPRLVLTQQDLISFHAPDQFASEGAWQGYRELTRLAVASADRVLFFSHHARNEALAAELVEPGRADVIPIGTDHALMDAAATACSPSALQELDRDSELILCLGTDMRHKNREFALALVGQLRQAHEWHGKLVFAGPHVPMGSSRPAEARRLAADPGLAGAVLDLGEVSDGEREWLLERATLVLYPTVHEGFGLVPYEAAARGVPCLWAPGTALAEMLGPESGGIVSWDLVASADRALALMSDPTARAAHVAAVLAAGRELSWSRAGQALVSAYRAAAEGPPAPAGAIARGSGVMGAGVSPNGMLLVGPDGLLPADVERPLLAVLSRPRLAAPVLGALRRGYSVARRRAGVQ
jgi:glycosyltransferase involved in cell wall biosynthesis